MNHLDTFIHTLPVSVASPPLVVFDCDGTIISGDIGEAMFYRQIDRFLFRISPALLWHDHPKRTELGNLYDGLSILPPERRRSDGRFDGFAALLLSHYFRQLAEGRTAKACADIVRLLGGFTVAEAREIAAGTLRAELQATPGERMLGGQRLPQGIRYIRETVERLGQIKQRGADILVISGSNRWSVEAVFARCGLVPAQILGIDLQEEGGTLLPVIHGHVPVLEGKVNALRAITGRRPSIVFSDSTYDLPLFHYAEGMCVFVNSRNGGADGFFQTAGFEPDERWAVLDHLTLEQTE